LFFLQDTLRIIKSWANFVRKQENINWLKHIQKNLEIATIVVSKPLTRSSRNTSHEALCPAYERILAAQRHRPQKQSDDNIVSIML